MRKALQQLEEENERLKEENKRFRDAIYLLTDFVFIDDNNFINWNQAYTLKSYYRLCKQTAEFLQEVFNEVLDND